MEQPALPPAIEAEAKTWAMACHLSALSAVVGLPFGHVLGPLVCWLLRKDRYAFVDDQGKEALNFQLSMTIYGFVATLLSLALIGIPLLIALVIVDLVLVIIAAIRSSEGEAYRYPLTIRFIH
jgi:uncharacterized Tic20 family protein